MSNQIFIEQKARRRDIKNTLKREREKVVVFNGFWHKNKNAPQLTELRLQLLKPAVLVKLRAELDNLEFVLYRQLDEDLNNTCAYCEKTGDGFKACGGCKGPRYCSVACQKEDWPEHKGPCGCISRSRVL